MNALTLQQPYATLIAIGAKRIETRRWHPRENPGVIVIASSKKSMTAAQRDRCHAPPFSSALTTTDLPSGMIVAVARCHRFVRTEDVPEADLEREGDFGDFTPGRWGWYFDKVVALEEPVCTPPMRDKRDFRLHLWKLPDDLVQGELAAAIREAGDGITV